MSTRKQTIHLASGAKIIKKSTYIPPPRTRHVHHHHVQKPDSCFPATAKVLTPTGLRKLGELHPGDRVLSYSESSGTLVTRFVTRRLEHGPQALWAVRFDSVDEPMLTTPTHRFLTESGWRQARQLRKGDKLVFVDELKVKQATVVTSQATEDIAPVFNIYTSGEHNVVIDRVVAHNFVHFARLRGVLHNWFVDPDFDRMRPVAI